MTAYFTYVCVREREETGRNQLIHRVCFHEIQPHPFPCPCKLFVNEFHTVANGWESVCFHVLMKHNLWSESIVTWQSVKQQLSWQAWQWMNEWMNVHESAAFDSWLQMTRALASVTGIPQSGSCPLPDLQCFMFASWWSCTRGLNQIWLQVRGNSRKF
jgi:hypothetical protein